MLIAPAAQDWLGSAASPAVHSLYRNSVNLVDAEGELLSVVLPDSGPGPFALVVRPQVPGFQAAGGFEAWLQPDSRVEAGGQELEIGPLQVAYGTAARWNPRPSWDRVGPQTLRNRIVELKTLLIDRAPEGSFAPLVDPAALEPLTGLGAAALAAAAEPARSLLLGLRQGAAEAVGHAAERLAGLGGGVTPSGDDYLLGATQAIWAVTEPAAAQELTHAIVSHAISRTNLISGAWLKAAGRGEAGSEWHVLAIALASGGPVEEAAEWLIRRGHTSGADAMAGFLAAAEVLLGT